MNLYDDIIKVWSNLKNHKDYRSIPFHKTAWRDAGNNNMVFQSDMAFTLGGDRRFETGCFAVTENASICECDEIGLIGPDICEISESVPFSRLTVVRLKKDVFSDGEKLFKDIQDIEFTKYHVNPEGYMLRISSVNGIESVRVSKKAVAAGLSFSDIGSMYIEKYHDNPAVEAVRVLFVTDCSFDFDGLSESIKKVQNITKALDGIHEKMSVTDCATCNLSEICNEVEGLRELHFSMKK